MRDKSKPKPWRNAIPAGRSESTKYIFFVKQLSNVVP